ncbi:alpha/beta hydrolase family protein [Companilactobacillus alimentarius]|uniref:Tributyrin esterase n=1 Tax=Companilactobacillus alimentarius DSM 20249 TaxID=1423720 RepID=A0A2K9HRN4_9LACO|nr:alpha/beta hydrolase family protein [Companilactobacillus alimentarius]AUI72622.1 tributyrin esterase [Companilactobacillus alimentarius DSM 20249]KRK76413.1 tributyrin esterase [Companilactobacillus alimentarius DSM 20249]MDT6952254.1 alpha/beta hydrolase family protein [Companilactobacillus alimentarius]GEO45632.1 tributyrin esterase [Companilactobacillus alimentarius]
MVHLKINYFSNALLKDCQMDVCLPDENKTKDKLPIIYLLHGMSDDNTSWIRKTRVERLLKSTKVALVMPNADLSWYANTPYGMNYYDEIAYEIPRVIHELFPQLSDKREKNFVVGSSMGGYGAFKLALSTNKFSYAAALSGAFNPKSNLVLRSFRPEKYWYGTLNQLDDFDTSVDNLDYLAKTRSTSEPLPKFFAWCGKQDFLYQDNLNFINTMNQLNIPIEHKFTDGKHDWYYWDKYLEEILKWLPINYSPEERLS